MITSHLLRNTFIALLMFPLGSFAQKSEPNVKMTFGKGVQFTSADNLFTLALSGRIQSLAEIKHDLTGNTTTSDFLLRRCRLNVMGTAFNPKFTYRIQIGFAHGDITSGNSSVQNNLILRDAMLYYAPAKWLKFGFGQTKLPGNRQRQVSSANLQLVERSIANNNFTLDRDKGIWLFTNFNIMKTVLKTTLTVSSGEGRIVSDKNGKICYSGRMEWMPLGEFTNGGDLIESDQEKEKKPKISIAGVYSFNDDNSRTMGQLGDYLYNSQTSDITYYGADLLFKYKGFSFESEWYNRDCNTGIIVNSKDSTLKNYVVSGQSFLIQSGYFISKKTEVAMRYAHITPDQKLSSLAHEQDEYVLGCSHYFSKHSLKLQSDLSYFVNGPHENLTFRLSGVVTF
ncbi:MAG: hypothetical protein JNJ58_13190 [Chitinophagaceae bacterium]|nr:hypothetical protein [Chitinophagaceae bacterium]